jgi:cleavage and polyadenylation specificity factor subunit 1
MRSVKNFILLGDAQKSIWFLGFQLEPAKLSLLGKDYQSFEVGCVDFIIDDKSLYLVVGDTSENLDLYQYAPFSKYTYYYLLYLKLILCCRFTIIWWSKINASW